MDTKLKNFVLRVLALLLALVGAYFFLRYGLPVLIPFILSYVISYGIRPLARFLSEKTHIPKKVWAVVLIILSLAAVVATFWFLGSTLISELKEVLKTAAATLSDGNSPVRQASDKMMGIIREAGFDGEDFSVSIREMLTSAISKVTEALTGFLGSIVSATPSFLFFVVVMLLSLFYFSCDIEGIKKELSGFLPEKVMTGVSEWSGIGLRALGRFIRAYMSLLGITFGVLSVGFLIIGVDYPFLAALLCALVDILPVFGVGTVLVPWAVVLFLTGESATGVAMLVLFGVMYAVRQILEPKIVGGAAGVHPVLALFAVFLGFRLFGLGGMIAAPLLLNGVAVFWEEKKKKSLPES